MKKFIFLVCIIGMGHAMADNTVFHKNIMRVTNENINFRNVIATGPHSQIVLMSLKPGEDIGTETHDVDQVLIFTEGSGTAKLNGRDYRISAGDIFLVPAGTQHNFTNTSKQDLKLFTIYAPAEFEHEIVQKLKPKE